jgi:mono/diheme cytochrome c family protein
VNVLLKIDRVFAYVVWIAAAAFAWGLVIGPYAVAEDDAVRSAESAGAAPYGSTPGADGPKVFAATCGSCHTLSAAGTSGQVGPNLDDTSLSASDVESIVRDGRGGMPAFGGQLSEAEISAVAAFVSAAR